MSLKVDKAKKLKTDIPAVALALKNPKTPWYAKAVAAIAVAYALSPVDLIPDFIPVLGYYDHTVDDYIKKKLSDRMYKLADGTLVQRDWYSSFLLFCYDYKTNDIDKKKCVSEFDKCYDKEKNLIEWIRVNNIKVLNSGIKIA